MPIASGTVEQIWREKMSEKPHSIRLLTTGRKINNSIVHDNCRSKRKDYHLALCKFLNKLEIDSVRKLCLATETDEKMLWRLLRAQRSSSLMSAFLVIGSLITKENDIRDMWVDHFEALGTPTVNLNFDNEFTDLISTHVQTFFQNCTSDDSTGVLSGPLTYEEVVSFCSNLKPGSPMF